MMPRSLIFVQVVLLLAVSCTASPSVWPLPQSMRSGQSEVVLNPSTFTFTYDTTSPILRAAVARYKEYIFPTNSAPTMSDVSAVCQGLVIKMASTDETLNMGVSEKYTLDVPATGSAVLTADTVFGALRGLETFSQLVTYRHEIDTYVITSLPISIIDFPRFSHRAIMVDTARHFMPISTLYRIIDGIAFSKMNVLHWHVVDSQAYPLQSFVRPKLWDAAWSAKERYTLAQVDKVVEYARMRGVRVMLELDSPGHAWSWGVGYPEVRPANYSTQEKCKINAQCPNGNNYCNIPLDPSKELSYQIVADVLAELTGSKPGEGYAPDALFHLGGDEVHYACWEGSRDILVWMNKTGLQTYDEAYMYFVQRAQNQLSLHKRSAVFWEEVFTHFGTKLPKDTVFHVWKNHATMTKVVEAGYRGIMSDSANWYLDHATTWETMYSFEPCDMVSDDGCAKLVLGGETCAWSELQDISNVFVRLFPRACAVSERLWSSRTAIDSLDLAKDVYPRLANFKCSILHERGIPTSPMTPVNNLLYPQGPGSCYNL